MVRVFGLVRVRDARTEGALHRHGVLQGLARRGEVAGLAADVRVPSPGTLFWYSLIVTKRILMRARKVVLDTVWTRESV